MFWKITLSLIAFLIGLGFVFPGFFVTLLVLASPLERFNVFADPPGVSVKLFLVLLPFAFVSFLLGRMGAVRLRPTFLFFPLLFVLVVEALSIFTSFDPFKSFKVLTMHSVMVLFFLLVVAWIREGRGIRRIKMLVWAYLGAGVMVAVYAIWQFIRFERGLSPSPWFEQFFTAKTINASEYVVYLPYGIRLLRPSSTFIDVNTAAGFLMTALLLGTGLWFGNGRTQGSVPTQWVRRLRFPLLASCFLLLSVAFVMMFSRSAWIGLIAGMAVIGYMGYTRTGKRLRVKNGLQLLAPLVLPLLFAVIFYTAYQSYVVKQAELKRGNESGIATEVAKITQSNLKVSEVRRGSDLERVEYLRGAVTMFRTNPLLGVGAGNYENYFLSEIDRSREAAHSHSIYLTWLAELGVLGILAYAFLVFAVVRYTRRVPGYPTGVELAALAAFVGLLFSNMFAAYFGLEFTWIVLGVLVGAVYTRRVSGHPSGGKKPGGEMLKQVQHDISRRHGFSRHPELVSESIQVLGVRVDNVAMDDAVARVGARITSLDGRMNYVVTPNPEMIVMAQRDEEFRKILNDADLSVPDGIGVVWGADILGQELKERVTGTDLVTRLAKEASRNGWRIFLLGGKDGAAEKAAKKLKTANAKLKVVGTFEGDGGKKGDKETVRAINKAIEQSAPRTPHQILGAGEVGSNNQTIDILFVAYGHGKQERWIARNLPDLDVKVAVGVGGAFDFIGGQAQRAPKWARDAGLEWMYRLIKEPWRWKRQLSLPVFMWLVFKEWL